MVDVDQYLVGGWTTPLKIWKSLGMIIHNIWKNMEKRKMFQTTNQLWSVILCLMMSWLLEQHMFCRNPFRDIPPLYAARVQSDGLVFSIRQIQVLPDISQLGAWVSWLLGSEQTWWISQGMMIVSRYKYAPKVYLDPNKDGMIIELIIGFRV